MKRKPGFRLGLLVVVAVVAFAVALLVPQTTMAAAVTGDVSLMVDSGPYASWLVDQSGLDSWLVADNDGDEDEIDDDGDEDEIDDDGDEDEIDDDDDDDDVGPTPD